MRNSRLSTLGLDSETLLLATEGAEGANFTDLLFDTARANLENMDVRSASVAMHGVSGGPSGTARFAGLIAAEDLHDVADHPRVMNGRTHRSKPAGKHRTALDPVAMGVTCRPSYDPERSTYQCRETGEHVWVYVFQLPYRTDGRMGIEISLKFAHEDSDDLERLEFLIVPFYLAALRLFRIIDRGTVREWLGLVDGLSPVQLMILREIVGTPRYNLASISERLGIGKRGITSQLYRIQNVVEPKLPQPELQDGNGSPLVDLVRIFGFLQFTGRPAMGQAENKRAAPEQAPARGAIQRMSGEMHSIA